MATLPQWIEARVIQKIATEAEWNEITLVPYKGEVCLVGDSGGKVVNIKVGDGVNTFPNLEYMFDSIQQNVGYIAIESNALPTPEGDVAWGMVTGGTYTFGGSAAFTVPDGHWGIANYSSGVWSLVDMGVLPVDPNAIKKNEIDVSGGVVGFDTFSEVTVVSYEGVVLVDTSTTEFGYYQSANGNQGTSVNWLRIPYSEIPEEVKGTYINVNRFSSGLLPAGANLVSFRDSSGAYMPNDSVPGGDNFPKRTVVLVPLNAKTWGFSLVNATDIGDDPVNNRYTQGFSVVSEEVESVLLDETKINNPDNIVFTNPITEDGDGAVPAKEIFGISQQVNSISEKSGNMADMSQDIVSGFWTINGGHSNSNNWIKKQPIQFSDDIISRLENNEEIYLWVFGGGAVGSGGASVVFWDETNSVVYSEQGTGDSTYPLRVEIPLTARSIGVTIANVVDIGLDPLNSPYKATFYVGVEQESEVQPEYQPYGYVIKPSVLPDVLAPSIDTNEIILRKISDDMFHIFFHIGGREDTWFRINLRHQISESKFIDVWRIDQGWIVRRQGDLFTNVRRVIQEGVYENAIYTSGYPDALGSAHGWEMLEEFKLWMDGSEVNIEDPNFEEIVGTELNLTTLTMFKTVDGLGDVGKSFKRWRFKNGVFTIKNTINWLSSLQISTTGRSFVAMLSILRDDAQGNITHSAQSNEDGITYDVTEPGFETPIFTNAKDPRRNRITIWGDEFRAEMGMKRKITLTDGTVNSIGLTDAGMFVQNSELYNKLYGTFGYALIQPGDLWEVETEYVLLNAKN